MFNRSQLVTGNFGLCSSCLMWDLPRKDAQKCVRANCPSRCKSCTNRYEAYKFTLRRAHPVAWPKSQLSAFQGPLALPPSSSRGPLHRWKPPHAVLTASALNRRGPSAIDGTGGPYAGHLRILRALGSGSSVWPCTSDSLETASVAKPRGWQARTHTTWPPCGPANPCGG